jgi:hypothetical protein
VFLPPLPRLRSRPPPCHGWCFPVRWYCVRCAAVRQERLSLRDLRSAPVVPAFPASGARRPRRPCGLSPFPHHSAVRGTLSADLPYRHSPLPIPNGGRALSSWGITPLPTTRRVGITSLRCLVPAGMVRDRPSFTSVRPCRYVQARGTWTWTNGRTTTPVTDVGVGACIAPRAPQSLREVRDRGGSRSPNLSGCLRHSWARSGELASVRHRD